MHSRDQGVEEPVDVQLEVQHCMCGCGQTVELREVTVNIDFNDGRGWCPQLGIYCSGSIERAGGLLCTKHREFKRLFVVGPDQGRQELRSVCVRCAIESVRRMRERERTHLVDRLGRTDTERFLAVAQKYDTAWLTGMSAAAKVLAGVAIWYAQDMDPGDTLEEVIQIHVGPTMLTQ